MCVDLDLRWNNIREQGAILLLDAVPNRFGLTLNLEQKNSLITSIKLSGNSIPAAALRAIEQHLLKNPPSFFCEFSEHAIGA